MKDVYNQRLFFDQLAGKLNVKNPEDWLEVQSKVVLKEGGNFLNSYYGGSIIRGTKIIEILLEIQEHHYCSISSRLYWRLCGNIVAYDLLWHLREERSAATELP